MLDPVRKLRDGGEGDVLVFRGKRAGIGVAADESVLGRVNFDAGQDGIPARGGGKGRFERELAGAGAAFIKRGHGATPTGGGHRSLGVGELHLHEFLGFRECGCGDFGADLWSGAEGRWFAGGEIAGGLGLAAESRGRA